MVKGIHNYSLIPISISLYNSEVEKTIALGTGFYYSKNKKLYFITNWHNVTGLNPLTKEVLSEHGSYPDKIILQVVETESEHIKGWHSMSIDLYKDSDCCEPNWMIHPELGEKVDTIVIEDSFPEDFEGKISPINEVKWDTDFNESVGDDIFILGYPKGLTGGGYLPIWKRASIATEPIIKYGGLPCFLVDTATREGMSGSPVLFRKRGFHIKENNGKPDIKNSIIGTIWNFLGIYSGRILGKDELDAQLGIIWRSHVIDEIIDGKRYDTLKNMLKRP